jgi:hypothetical protein
MPIALPDSFTTKVDDRYLTGFDSAGRKTGPRLRETRVGAASTYGVPIPVSSGFRPMFGNIIWSAPLIENEYEAAGQLRYEYFGTFAVSFGAPVNPSADTNLVAVWLDGQLVYDARKINRVKSSWFNFEFYPGSETQLPDSTIVEAEGDGNVSAYRGQMHMVIRKLPLGPYDNRIPAVKVLLSDTAVEPDVTSMPATGSNNNVATAFDWNNEKLYVLNSVGTGTSDKLFVYDLATNAFLEERPYNQVNAAFPGVTTNSGLDYIPWLDRLVSMDDEVAVTRAAILVNPDTGIAERRLAGTSQINSWCPHYVDTNYGRFTYLFGFGLVEDADIVQITPDPAREMTLAKVNLTLPAGTLGVSGELPRTAGERDQDTCTYYFSGDGTDTIHKLVISPSLIGVDDDQAFEVTEDVFLNPGGTGTTTTRAILYDREKHQLLVIYADSTAALWDIASDTVIWQIDDLPGTVSGNQARNWDHDISGGAFAYVATGTANITEINLIRGTWTEYTNSLGTINSSGFGSSTKSNKMVGLGVSSGIAAVSRYKALNAARLTMADLITDLAESTGFGPSEVTVDSAVDDQVDGFLTDQQGTLSQILAPVRNVYNLEVIESGTSLKVNSRARGSTSPDFTITEADMIEDRRGRVFELELTEEQAIPSRVNVTYWEPQLNYNYATQTAFRSGQTRSADTEGQVSYNLPLVISADEAKYGAYNTLYNPWISQKTASFAVPPELALQIEPADLLQITYNDQVHLMKVLDWELNEDLSASLSTETFQLFEDFTMSAFFGTPYDQELPTVLQQNLVRLYAFEAPPIWEEDDTSGLLDSGIEPQMLAYTITTPGSLGSTFDGARVSYAPGFFKPTAANRDTLNYTDLDFEHNIPVPAGTVLTNLYLPERPFAFDEFETITIAPEVGDSSLLVSITVDELLAGGNLMLVGSNGATASLSKWEVIQFKDVNDNGDGTFTLTGILRGARHTDYVWAEAFGQGNGPGDSWEPTQRIVHEAGRTSFVLLNRNWVRPIKVSGLSASNWLSMKVRPNSGRVGQVGYTSVYLTGKSMIAPSPRNIRVTRDSTGKHTISWNRRYRLVSTLHDGDGDTPITDYEQELFWVIVRKPGSPVSQGVVYNATTQSVKLYQNDGSTAWADDAWPAEIYHRVIDGESLDITLDELYDVQYWGDIYNFYVNGSPVYGSPLTRYRQDQIISPEQHGILSGVATGDKKDRMAYGHLLVSVVPITPLPDLLDIQDDYLDLYDEYFGTPNIPLSENGVRAMQARQKLKYGQAFTEWVPIEDV